MLNPLKLPTALLVALLTLSGCMQLPDDLPQLAVTLKEAPTTG